jgi:hypothetical protein
MKQVHKILYLLVLLKCCFSILLSQDRIENGITKLDIDGDGQKDFIVKGYIENITAHSSDVYTIYILKTDPISQKTISNLVKFKKEKNIEYYISTYRGADCDLLDIRIGKYDTKDKGMQLIVGEREFGETYIDERNVTFTYYHLVVDEDSNLPIYIYEPFKKIISKNKYCDVNMAFKKELGL